jgi:hypothetical protein
MVSRFIRITTSGINHEPSQLFEGELETKVCREAIRIAANRLVETRGPDTVDCREIMIEDDLVTPNQPDVRLDDGFG